MAKITCKFCGTVYSDTAEVCPICNNPPSEKPAKTTAEKKSASDKKAAKGGYFTKANVKKRNASPTTPRVPVSVNSREPKPVMEDEEIPEKKSKLWIVILVLVLAIFSILAYIAWTYLMPYFVTKDPAAPTNPSTSAAVPSESAVTKPGEISCESLSLGKNTVTLANKDDIALLDIRVTPNDTTDALTFTTSDPAIAAVDEHGTVTAVGAGVARITAVCGEQRAYVDIVCTFKDDSTEPSDKPSDPTETTASDKTFELDVHDVTFAFKGETLTFDIGDIPADNVIWKSSDTDVCTVSDGVVKAVHSGETTVTATYEGKTDRCIVRCNFPDEADSGNENQSSGGNSENRPDGPVSYILNHIDVTLYVGNSFEIYLSDAEGYIMPVDFFSGDSSIVQVDGNDVTAVSGGLTTVYCTYEGERYQCIVRCYYSE